MSDKELASRTDVQVVFGGVDITVAAMQDLISFSYTDNEEDEADDFQLNLLDRDGKWLRKWLNPMLDNAAQGGNAQSTSAVNYSSGGSGGSSSSGASGNVYKVTASNGVNVRSSANESGKLLGKLPYGTVVDVHSFSNGWARITYQGKSGYIKGKNLISIGSGGSSSSNSATSGSTTAYASNSATDTQSGWEIGESVIVTGNPQYDSWGNGKPGKSVEKHNGKITHLNLKSGIPYPIHVDYLGWFAENQVQKAGRDTNGNTQVSGTKGLQISAVICQQNRNGDGKDTLLDCGTFELDSIDASGPPSTVSIKGTSLAYANTIRQTLKSRSWESTTLKAIAETITQNNGMGLVFESSSDPKYTRVEQYQMSDISFLQRLCHNAGCSLKATNNILVIFDQSEYEQKDSVRTIVYGEKGSYTKYKLATEENGNYASCRVYYTTQAGKVISATEYAAGYDEDDNKKGQHLEVRQKVSSVAEAQNLARKILKLHNKYEYSASFTFPGDPKLVAGVTVELKEFGMWDGKYIIKQAKHSISSSGYTTQINLRKVVAEAENKEVKATVAPTDEELREIAMQVIRGEWGNGADRKKKLTEAGYDYAAVQAQVNKILYG